jgi:UDP-N-acetylglucosamine 2-epimerase (non-hydrolysing)
VVKEKLKVTTIVGTRPEIIRLSVLLGKFDQIFEHRLIFSSQNRQSFVGSNFFDELKLKQPNSTMSNTSNTVAEFISALLVFVENEIIQHRPDAVVILGDTNTSLAALIVKKYGIPVYHLEAGNRSFDANVPEELNRKIVDHASDFNLAYSQQALLNLLREGLPTRNTLVIGSPLREVIELNRQRIKESEILKSLKIKSKEFFLVSAHRQENIDDVARLSALIDTLNAVAEKFTKPLIISTHPRLQSMLEKGNYKRHEQLKFVEPLGFIDYCKLQNEASAVLSDSGSIAEESAILGFKALTMRDSMERPEALEAATIELTGLDSARVIAAIERLESTDKVIPVPSDYQITNTSDRVINFILSTHHVRDFWNGIR